MNKKTLSLVALLSIGAAALEAAEAGEVVVFRLKKGDRGDDVVGKTVGELGQRVVKDALPAGCRTFFDRWQMYTSLQELVAGRKNRTAFDGDLTRTVLTVGDEDIVAGVEEVTVAEELLPVGRRLAGLEADIVFCKEQIEGMHREISALLENQVREVKTEIANLKTELGDRIAALEGLNIQARLEALEARQTFTLEQANAAAVVAVFAELVRNGIVATTDGGATYTPGAALRPSTGDDRDAATVS